jgi:Arc/MetJ-type ribon-helix-helix transcriptional regulator
MAQARGSSVSDLVRALIDRSYAEEQDKARVAAARRIGEMSVEDVPEPSVLKNQFAQAHDPEHTDG